MQNIKKLGFIFIENRTTSKQQTAQKNTRNTKEEGGQVKNAQKIECGEPAKTCKTNNIFNIWGERIKAFYVMIKIQSSAEQQQKWMKKVYTV